MTNPLNTAAGYIVQDKDGYAIAGFGATADAAWAMTCDGIGTFHDAQGDDVAHEVARETQFLTIPATAALIAEVELRGGAISWTVVNGIACTDAEAEGDEE